MASDPATTIYVTRHGLAEHNLRTEVYMGRSPEARLLPEGREQALRLAERAGWSGSCRPPCRARWKPAR